MWVQWRCMTYEREVQRILDISKESPSSHRVQNMNALGRNDRKCIWYRLHITYLLKLVRILVTRSHVCHMLLLLKLSLDAVMQCNFHILNYNSRLSQLVMTLWQSQQLVKKRRGVSVHNAPEVNKMVIYTLPSALSIYPSHKIVREIKKK